MSKQVVIQGGKDDWYEKAVFWLKYEPPKGRMNLVSEANHIIGAYIKTTPVEEVNKTPTVVVTRNAKWIDGLFYGSLVLLVITLVLYLV